VKEQTQREKNWPANRKVLPHSHFVRENVKENAFRRFTFSFSFFHCPAQ